MYSEYAATQPHTHNVLYTGEVVVDVLSVVRDEEEGFTFGIDFGLVWFKPYSQSMLYRNHISKVWGYFIRFV